MATTRNTCSLDGCKRAVVCLCRHCQRDVCLKHFNEHQGEVNDELVLATDNLNQLKMRLKTDNDKTSIFADLKSWRNKKYDEIDREYNRRYAELEQRVSVIDKKITKTMNVIRQLLEEGDVSVDEVRDIQQKITSLNNQIDQLLNNEFELVGTFIQLGSLRFLVKSKIKCGETDLYALECERVVVGYDGQCPKCGRNHVEFQANRGMYAMTKSIHEKVFQ